MSSGKSRTRLDNEIENEQLYSENGDGVITEPFNPKDVDIISQPMVIANIVEELKEGGNVDALFQLMMEGTLEAPVPVFPKLRDTAPQMLLENRLESMSQI